MDNEALMNILVYELEQMDHLLQVLAHVAAVVMGDTDEDEIFEDDVYWHVIHIDRNDFYTMGDPSFSLHFRMKRGTFETLVEVVTQHMKDTHRSKEERTPVCYILMMVLWIMATPDCFRSVALLFGVRPTTVDYHFLYMIEVLKELAPRYITWPNARERAEIKEAFEERKGFPFPGIIGCIDGTHIKVTAPRYNKARYVNRHDSYSMNTQIVCDDRLLIRDITVGNCGGRHDSNVFRDSTLCQCLLEDPNVISFEEHLLGDGGYTLTDSVIIPFRRIGNLTDLQRNYNAMHASSRAVIENCNALLKGKWRRLGLIYSMHPEIVIDLIMASAMLHNFVILNGEEPGNPFERAGDDVANALHGMAFDDNVGSDEEDQMANGDENEENNEEEDEDVEADREWLWAAAKERGIEKRLHIMRNLPRRFF